MNHLKIFDCCIKMDTFADSLSFSVQTKSIHLNHTQLEDLCRTETNLCSQNLNLSALVILCVHLH